MRSRKRNGADDFDAAAQRRENAARRRRVIANGDEKFLRPTSLEELFAIMAEHPDARLIAGATELGLDITKKFRKFPTLISVEAIPELTRSRRPTTEWHDRRRRHADANRRLLGAEFPALREMLLVFGSRQIRNRATMGGNLVTASPIGDCAPVLLALDARGRARVGQRANARLPLDEFFVAYRKTALQPGEILKTILLPRIAQPTPVAAQILQGFEAARNGHQHRGGLLSRFDWTRTERSFTRGWLTAAWRRCRCARAQDRSRR